MRRIFAVIRVLMVFSIIAVFIVQMSCVWLFLRNRWRRLRHSNEAMRPYARMTMRLLGIRLNLIGTENLTSVRTGLLVGNHLSYTDVLAVSSARATAFVTSNEIKATPVLGLICQMAGCLFVERRNKQNILNEVSELREGLQVGLDVAIFPEATSTNGEQILRFRRPLFVAAIDSGRPVIPFCLNYRRVGGKPVDITNRDNVMWYGDMGFAPHVIALAASGGVDLDLHFLPPIHTTLKMDPRELAAKAQEAVESVFVPVTKPQPLEQAAPPA